MAAADPRTSATTEPGSQRSPSRRRAVNTAPGSSWRKASAATSRPAITQSHFARTMPRARNAGSTVASVVTSPQPRSSASARRTGSRYSAGSSGSNGILLIATHLQFSFEVQLDHRAVTFHVAELSNVGGGFEIRLYRADTSHVLGGG